MKKGFIDILGLLALSVVVIAGAMMLSGIINSTSSTSSQPPATLTGKWDFTILIRGGEIDFPATVIQSATSVSIASSSTTYKAKLNGDKISFQYSTSNATITFWGTVSNGKAEMDGSVEVDGYFVFSKKQKIFDNINGIWFAVKNP